jgi:hypothetical protein
MLGRELVGSLKSYTFALRFTRAPISCPVTFLPSFTEYSWSNDWPLLHSGRNGSRNKPGDLPAQWSLVAVGSELSLPVLLESEGQYSLVCSFNQSQSVYSPHAKSI